jgi:hypothetical protein
VMVMVIVLGHEGQIRFDGKIWSAIAPRSRFSIVGFGLAPVKITIVTDLNLPNGQYTV